MCIYVHILWPSTATTHGWCLRAMVRCYNNNYIYICVYMYIQYV